MNKINRLLLLLIVVVIAFTLVACGDQTEGTLTPEETSSVPVLQTETTKEPVVPILETVVPSGGAVDLTIWLPIDFNPAGDSAHSLVLKNRLDEFTNRRTGSTIEVRIKEVEGPGGLLETLTTASSAAPDALPDLIALPYSAMETAALKGLLYPIDDLAPLFDNVDWFPVAVELASVQDTYYGMPFAADAMVLVYRPAEVGNPPSKWADVIKQGEELLFNAADPEMMITLSQYLSSGGEVLDDEHKPTLEAFFLTRVFSFYNDLVDGDLFPTWKPLYAEDDEVWNEYVFGRNIDMVMLWSSTVLRRLPPNSAISPMPTEKGVPHSLGTGWVWAIPAENTQELESALQLAAFLSTSEFTAEWTEAAGFFPVRSSAVELWRNQMLKAVASIIMPSVKLTPQHDVVNALAPRLQEAVQSVIKGGKEPSEAASDAVQGLNAP